MSEAPKKYWRASTFVLLIVMVAVFVGSLVLAPKPAKSDEEAFGGTDAQVTEVLEKDGTKPWFTPIFEPGSSEVESGLFALQASIGAGIMGFALGRLGRRKAVADELAARGLSDDDGVSHRANVASTAEADLSGDRPAGS